MVERKAYVLSVNPERARFSKQILTEIGFEVYVITALPHDNPVVSNKISMISIYETILTLDDEWVYVFEDDINIHESVKLEEIIKYEHISTAFFYLGLCETHYSLPVPVSDIIISNHPVYIKTGGVRGLHAIGISKLGARALIEMARKSNYDYMDMILEQLSEIYPAPVVRYDLESYIGGHKGLFFQDRNKFPSGIDYHLVPKKEVLTFDS